MSKKKKEEEKEESTAVKKFKAVFSKERILTEKSNEAVDLYNKSRYGEYVEDKIQYSFVEALHLMERKRLNLKDGKNKAIKIDKFRKTCEKIEENFWVRYCVFRDLRRRGYIVKTALKFGADFRVYDKGVKPGDDHAKGVVLPVQETSSLTWYEFSAKNRVAHSTKKRRLLGFVFQGKDDSFLEPRTGRT